MILRICLFSIFTLLYISTYAQKKAAEWFVNGSVNCYIPGKSSGKSVFPILGYNKNTSPKLLLGGLGVGVSLWAPAAKDLYIKSYANLTKMTYWDDQVQIRDAVGLYMGNYQAWSSDYALNLGGLIHYSMIDRLSLGAGIGLQGMIASLSRMPEMYGYGLEVEPSFVVNRYYKRILPVVPLELSYKLDKMVVNLRYDIGLLNKFKGDLGKSKSEKFGVLALEVGFKLN